MYSTEPSALARQAIAGIESSVACSWTACSARLRSVKSSTNATPSLLPLTSTGILSRLHRFCCFRSGGAISFGRPSVLAQTDDLRSGSELLQQLGAAERLC